MIVLNFWCNNVTYLITHKLVPTTVETFKAPFVGGFLLLLLKLSYNTSSFYYFAY